MKAGDVTLGHVFAADHHLVVPLFQRPYVWGEDPNWLSLWTDVRTAAEEVEAEVFDEHGRHDPRTYFLGAVVIQSRRHLPRRLSSSNVIDGQQRLTTLQVLLAAARRVALRIGAETSAGLFSTLLDNKREAINPDHPEDLHKLWPLPQDNGAFRWALRTENLPVPLGLGDHKLVKAAEWFEESVFSWCISSDDPELRLGYLFETLRDRMQLVQIYLESYDDPQVIFEALNHRGVKLDAADLVKNLLFQKVEQQGDHKRADTLLLDSWLPLDGQHWRRQVTTGRMKRSRIDLLLSYWLTIQTSGEVSAEHLFVNVRNWLTSSPGNNASAPARAADLIVDIRRYADKYDELEGMPSSSNVGALLNRMQATGTMTPWPLLLRVFADDAVPSNQKDLVARAIDSFLMRRGVARMPNGDYNKLFVQLMEVASGAEPECVGDTVVGALAAQTADSRRWPSDEEFAAALADTGLYKSVYRARLRSLLVGLENHLQSGKTEPGRQLSSTDSKLNIEHLMPQEWGKHWALPDNHTEDDLLRRTSAVHQLGNLTLVTTKLNPSLSNKNWEYKKPAIQKHSLLRLTTGSVLSRPETADEFDEASWSDQWDEARIAARTHHLIGAALEAWPRPTDAAPAESVNSPEFANSEPS
ncbi:DUF262 domain-containing protein [Arthrobacter sp. FW306-06-A]|uniref:DUF262 domain-containing protein n=1 Tax=Arthrobacter sp. FW306-06-A TaxID=2879621 RepID=UPI001F239B7F|nr:DUF262 domain-containing protein [Arthrobacter sp. FW306-06-A]UKA72239.1 DUF262 domain-containing HNH endonuclease family protein [Arthrobacter sp. FW306-06-A]